jgi:Zn-dependent protease
MGGSFKIGRFSGIDVRVHWTFLLLVAFFAFIGYQTSGSLAGALTPIAVIVALFLCVLLHEFGHSLVAQRLGIETGSPIWSPSPRSLPMRSRLPSPVPW